jgi:folate-dependent phosphoribosylglycinamide formyltransferase PurN
LAARVLAVEHRIYPEALKMLAEGRCPPVNFPAETVQNLVR